MTIELWLSFAMASAVLLVIPGPTILAVVSYSITGRSASWPLVAAVTCGDATALVLSLAGLGAVLATSATLFSLVKLAGGLYLMVWGISMLRRTPTTALTEQPNRGPAQHRGLLNTYMVTALNPKGMVFFVAFLPQFIRPGEDAQVQLWVLACTFVILAAINASLYVRFAARLGGWLTVSDNRRKFDVAGGSVMACIGGWTVIDTLLKGLRSSAQP